MDDLEKTFVDIDNLAKKIEERILELEQEREEKPVYDNYFNDSTKKNIDDLTDLINEIDRRILELELEDSDIQLDLDDLTEKVNVKIEALDTKDIEEDWGKALHDLNEVSKVIDKTIKELERQKAKKRKKAMYCDMARKKEHASKNKKRKISK